MEPKKRRREPEPPSRKPLPTHRRVRSRLILGRRDERYTRRRYTLDVEKESKRARNVTWLKAQVGRLTEMLAWRRTEQLLPEGDYSDAQLDCVNQQALILKENYKLLCDAAGVGGWYSVYCCAAEAGASIGVGFDFDHRTVRKCSGDYIGNGGTVNADGRGHYERELLINEEDLHRKFTKWSVRTAKSDTLSVEAARDWLNEHILGSLPANVLSS